MWWLGGCDDGPRGEETGPVWSEAFDPGDAGPMSGVWGSGPDDVWVVGGTPDRGRIFHFDGAGWAEVPAPELGLLVWVTGSGPDEALAVGVGGAAAAWDGAAWRALDAGTDADLWGVWGPDPAERWVVGGDPDAGDPVILRVSGDTFTPVALDPAENDRRAHALFKVFGVGGRTFAVGQLGLVVAWDGSAWRQEPTGPAATDDFVSLWGLDASEIVAVGGRSNGLVARFDGGAWTTRSAAVPGLSAVSASPDEFVVAGLSGFAGHLPAGGAPDADPISEDSGTRLDLHAVWFDGADRFYAVGGRFYAPFEGVVRVRERR